MATVHRGRLVKRLKNKGLHAEGATFGLYIYTRTFHNYLFALLIFPKCSRTNEWELARRWWLRDFNLCVSTTMVRHIRHPIMDAPTECAVHSKRVLWIILITHLVGAWVLCVCVFFCVGWLFVACYFRDLLQMPILLVIRFFVFRELYSLQWKTARSPND